MSQDPDRLPAELEHLVGKVIADRYRIDGVLGVGGMGSVFRCHHLGLKRDVAVKVLHPELTQDPEFSARFDREAHSASRLDHPNCIQVTDFGTWTPTEGKPGIKFMAMQLLTGGELTHLLRAPLEPERAVELLLQIARGLEHAHDHGIVHRDLKPENVFVTTDHAGQEVLKLVDFGIAKIVTGEEAKVQMTRAGLVFGTPRYMSPEQATGSPVDARTDVYSAGILFYQMLAGHPPFESDDAVALVRMQIMETPPPLPATVPAALVAIVDKMMAKDRASRYQDARSMREALEAASSELREPVQDIGMEATLASVSAKIRLTASAPFAAAAKRDMAGLRRVALIAGAGLLSLMLLMWVWPDDGDKGNAAAATVPEPVAVGSWLPDLTTLVEPDEPEPPPPPPEPGAPADKVAELDKMILGSRVGEARKLLSPLLDEFPKDAQLHWRRGKLLARDKHKRASALASYEDAIDLDPALLEQREFYAEVLDLMRQPKLLEQSLNLALQKMGEHGHKYLLELVNREKTALGYVSRHRVLDALAGSPENAGLINGTVNLALDLWQAKDSMTPCTSFSVALKSIAAAPDAYYLGTLHQVPLPEPRAGDGLKEKADAAVCHGLEVELVTLRNDLKTKFATPEEEWVVPADYRKRKRRRRGPLRRLFGG